MERLGEVMDCDGELLCNAPQSIPQFLFFLAHTHTHTPSRMHMYRLVDAVTRSVAGGCLFIHLHVGSQQDGLITSRGQ